MCNLHANMSTQEAMRRLFDIPAGGDRLGNFAPLPAIYPRHEAPVVRLGREGGRELVAMHWGFVLPQKSKKTGQPILPKAVTNARDDKLRASAFWRESFEERRCLVPATSFAEPKGRRPARYYWFGMAAEEAQARTPFAFAGLWRRYEGLYRGERVEIDTHTIVTTRPNELVARVHPDRMPVILSSGDYETWLSAPADAAARLLRPFPAEAMRIVREGEGETADPAEDG